MPTSASAIGDFFTAVGLGSSWVVDDVYVDPYKKG
jgi:hypothetical protein